jgi:hypothetical protein
MMGMTEIVQATRHIHPGFEGMDFTSQSASSSHPESVNGLRQLD